MAIQPTDIVLRLSGGTSNASAAASLGGAESSTVAPTSRFGTRPATDGSGGKVVYRCLYVHNTNASLTLQGATLSVSSDTPDASTTIAIGVGTAGVNATEQTIANETTAPTGVTFGTTATLGNIPAGQSIAIWERLTITAGASAVSADPYTLQSSGSTAA